jgi:hypothetical protein
MPGGLIEPGSESARVREPGDPAVDGQPNLLLGVFGSISANKALKVPEGPLPMSIVKIHESTLVARLTSQDQNAFLDLASGSQGWHQVIPSMSRDLGFEAPPDGNDEGEGKKFKPGPLLAQDSGRCRSQESVADYTDQYILISMLFPSAGIISPPKGGLACRGDEPEKS